MDVGMPAEQVLEHIERNPQLRDNLRLENNTKQIHKGVTKTASREANETRLFDARQQPARDAADRTGHPGDYDHADDPVNPLAAARGSCPNYNRSWPTNTPLEEKAHRRYAHRRLLPAPPASTPHLEENEDVETESKLEILQEQRAKIPGGGYVDFSTGQEVLEADVITIKEPWTN
ncbi:uncharacterized protein ATNIH1004_009192 [Aspergillus tanneri]|uniref:Uncharacterized protein n=1 Tax=Aspergillus tanneri TaxID=1220188 RepID=A0A5M9MDH7_9EURO|nr:uncharacterized protein ATNIH1004_009192 [Aspergillus tanneri]KAA8644981.1 hypothetical protein ATNIH1004_009192 [Aspergillus tanneri]